jgi:hypothetical protein
LKVDQRSSFILHHELTIQETESAKLAPTNVSEAVPEKMKGLERLVSRWSLVDRAPAVNRKAQMKWTPKRAQAGITRYWLEAKMVEKSLLRWSKSPFYRRQASYVSRWPPKCPFLILQLELFFQNKIIYQPL